MLTLTWLFLGFDRLYTHLCLELRKHIIFYSNSDHVNFQVENSIIFLWHWTNYLGLDLARARVSATSRSEASVH